MKLSQPAKGWKGRTGGELVGSFSTGSPPCGWVSHYRQSPNHFSLRQPRVRCWRLVYLMVWWVLPALGRIPQLLRLSELRYVGGPTFLTKPQMREKPLLTPPSQAARLGGDVPEEGIRVAIVVATLMIATPQ